MFIACNGIVLHADLHGEADRPVVAFVNSLGTDARIWRALLPAFDGFRVLLYDKRGHGLSDAPGGDYTIGEHAADLLALLDAFGIARCALVGLSVGGMIAQRIAAEHPERLSALVLCDTATRIGDAASWTARIAAVAAGGCEAIADAVMERWFTAAYRGREPVALRGWRNMLARQPAEGYAGTCAAIRDADLEQAAGIIRLPTLCLVGDDDRSTPPDLVRAMAEQIPGARFEIVAGAGHLPCIEQPAALAALVRRHLELAGSFSS